MSVSSKEFEMFLKMILQYLEDGKADEIKAIIKETIEK